MFLGGTPTKFAKIRVLPQFSWNYWYLCASDIYMLFLPSFSLNATTVVFFVNCSKFCLCKFGEMIFCMGQTQDILVVTSSVVFNINGWYKVNCVSVFCDTVICLVPCLWHDIPIWQHYKRSQTTIDFPIHLSCKIWHFEALLKIPKSSTTTINHFIWTIWSGFTVEKICM